jgi:hypothetical protein|tara:strand:+ start:260 stop:466 length:207 start_codon:yes stop_codon:yes gene_type:complete
MKKFLASLPSRVFGIFENFSNLIFKEIEKFTGFVVNFASSAAQAAVRVLFCIILYKVAFEGLLTGLFS